MACHWRNPSSPADIGTTFKLYTRQNRYSGDVLDRTDDATITSSNFGSSRDTKLIVHGWTDSMTGSSWIDMRDALLDNVRTTYHFQNLVTMERLEHLAGWIYVLYKYPILLLLSILSQLLSRNFHEFYFLLSFV